MDKEKQVNYADHGSVNSLIAIQAIAAAVAEERERCAGIAEGFGALDGEEDRPVYRARTVGNAIAITIRNGSAE